jgi:hypothetical protein
MKHSLAVFLSAASVCAVASLAPSAALAFGGDSNAQINQSQMHPWEANREGWTPWGKAVGEVYPAAPGGFIGPNGYEPGYDEVVPVVPVVPVAPSYTYGPAPAYRYYVTP